jgi:hypothetical protein
MTEEREKLWRAIDRVDNLAHALDLRIPDSTHVALLKDSLPEAVAELKSAFFKVTGEYPWEEI